MAIRKKKQPKEQTDWLEVIDDTGLFTRSMLVRGIDEDRRSVDVIASTDAIDGHGEIVEQVWNLDRFRSNPVILWNHNRMFQQDTLPIGKATYIGIEKVDGRDALVATIQFASEKANPKGEQVWNSFQEGTLRAVSVGFNPNTVRVERRDDKDVTVLSDNVLMEISATPIGSNPEALARRLSKALDTQKTAKKGEQMDVEEILQEKMASLAKLEVEFNGEKAKVETLNERCKDLEEQLANEKTRADGLTHKLLGQRLDGLVGKKISPAEKTTLVKLAVQSPDLFEEHLKSIEARPDMNTLMSITGGPDGDDGEPLVPKALPAPSNGKGGEDFDNIIRQRVFG